MKTISLARRAALVASLWSVAASAAEGYAHKVPEGFKPLGQVIAIDADAPSSAGPATIDLGWGAIANQCPTGAWTGTVRFTAVAAGEASGAPSVAVAATSPAAATATPSQSFISA